ncbi:MAG: bifunctional adenosylcobinamide kinase/adenosylcobinamide-phosphate guanylyltransferase [Pseudomonadota bacterium]
MTPNHLPHLTFILGGARSGKSRYAEELITSQPSPWTYVATAEVWDDEMRKRVEHHRARRIDGWQTHEVPYELPEFLTQRADGNEPILIDCLTLWLSNALLAHQDLDQRIDLLLSALQVPTAPIVIVSNEVGMGIVPENALARKFRDLQGRLNSNVAALADRAVLVAAGLPLVLKTEKQQSKDA